MKRKKPMEEAGGGGGEGSDHKHLFVFTADKAGMGNADKEHVNRVVYEMSKNSAYFAHAKKNDEKTDAKIAEYKQKLATLDLGPSALLSSASTSSSTSSSSSFSSSSSGGGGSSGSSGSSSNSSNPLLRRVVELERQLERARYCSRPCVVVDMDAFFAAVEMRDDPRLLAVPMAVGGTGMISTANYVARQKGVRSAMPGFIARQLCPELVFVKPNFAKYKAASAKVKAVLLEYDPHARMMSLDEGKLDLSAFFRARRRKKRMRQQQQQQEQQRQALASSNESSSSSSSSSSSDGGSGDSSSSSSSSHLAPGPHSDEDEDNEGELLVRDDELAAVVREMRAKVKVATNGLTCSAGLGPNFMVAKIASDVNKPDGQCAVPLHSVERLLGFLRPVPVRKVGGVGKVTEKVLSEVLGVRTVQDLFEKRAQLLHVFGPRSKKAEFLFAVSLAVDSYDERKAAAAWAGGSSSSKSAQGGSGSDLSENLRGAVAVAGGSAAGGGEIHCADVLFKVPAAAFSAAASTTKPMTMQVARRRMPTALLAAAAAAALGAQGSPARAFPWSAPSASRCGRCRSSR